MNETSKCSLNEISLKLKLMQARNKKKKSQKKQIRKRQKKAKGSVSRSSHTTFPSTVHGPTYILCIYIKETILLGLCDLKIQVNAGRKVGEELRKLYLCTMNNQV